MNLTNGNEFQSKKSRGMKSVDLNSIVAIIPRDWIEILPDITRVSLPTAQSSYLVKWNGKKKKKKGKKGEKREKGEKKEKKEKEKEKKNDWKQIITIIISIIIKEVRGEAERNALA